MPWRDDFLDAYWIAPQFGFGSYEDPNDRNQEEEPPTLSRVLQERHAGPLRSVRVQHVGELSAVDEDLAPRGAVFVLRDRIGFKYERVVGLNDHITLRDAAKLMRVPVMTVNRWVRGKVLKGRKRNGYCVVLLRDVLKLAKDQKRALKVGGRLVSVE